IEAGYIYIAQPPLYRVRHGKTEAYLYSDEELAEFLRKAKSGQVEVARYKGLGEMNPEQLWETTMNPERRTLKRVTMEDATEADEVFRIPMGEAVEPRREFIEKHARQVENLDV
ncbi:MAG: DNA topoisomerase IV subunit B, partial [candidate division WOR-3 bacterium]